MQEEQNDPKCRCGRPLTKRDAYTYGDRCEICYSDSMPRWADWIDDPRVEEFEAELAAA